MKTRKCFSKMCVCILAAWLFPQWAVAENVQKLVIVKNDNTEVSFFISEQPTIKFEKEDYERMYVVTSNNTVELHTPMLHKMTVVSTDDVVTNVNNLMTNGVSSFVRQGDAFMVTVTSGSTMITVQNIDGRQILSKRLGQGCHALSLSDFPTGVYVVNINNESIKIYKR